MRIGTDAPETRLVGPGRHLKWGSPILDVEMPPTYQATQWKYRGTNRAMIEYFVNDERIEINLLRDADRDNRAR